MDIDLDESRVLTYLVGALAGAVIWIYRLGGKVKSYELDLGTMKSDVDDIKSKVNEGVAARHNMEKRLERIDVTQSHISTTLDRIANKIESI